MTRSATGRRAYFRQMTRVRGGADRSSREAPLRRWAPPLPDPRIAELSAASGLRPPWIATCSRDRPARLGPARRRRWSICPGGRETMAAPPRLGSPRPGSARLRVDVDRSAPVGARRWPLCHPSAGESRRQIDHRLWTGIGGGQSTSHGAAPGGSQRQDRCPSLTCWDWPSHDCASQCFCTSLGRMTCRITDSRPLRRSWAERADAIDGRLIGGHPAPRRRPEAGPRTANGRSGRPGHGRW
jgi:hypothetical protein